MTFHIRDNAHSITLTLRCTGAPAPARSSVMISWAMNTVHGSKQSLSEWIGTPSACETSHPSGPHTKAGDVVCLAEDGVACGAHHHLAHLSGNVVQTVTSKGGLYGCTGRESSGVGGRHVEGTRYVGGRPVIGVPVAKTVLLRGCSPGQFAPDNIRGCSLKEVLRGWQH